MHSYSVRVDDALGRAGRARAVQNDEWMIERHLLKVKSLFGVGVGVLVTKRQKLVERDSVCHPWSEEFVLNWRYNYNVIAYCLGMSSRSVSVG